MIAFFNRQSLCFFLLLTPLFSFAFFIPKNEPYTPRYYLGIGIGGINGQFHTTSLTEVSPSFSFFSNQSINPKTSDTKLLGSIYVGKLFAYQRLLFGPELYLNLGAPNSNWTESASLLFPAESLITSTDSQLNTVDLGIDGRIGVLTNISSILYGRVGVSFNKLNNNITTINSRPTIPLIVTNSNSADHHLIGLRVGGGLEQAITPSLSIRGDYIFTYYPSTSQFFTGTAVPADIVVQLGPMSNNMAIKVSTQVALISLVYHWNSQYEK